MWEVKNHSGQWIIVVNGTGFTRGAWASQETAQAWADHFNADHARWCDTQTNAGLTDYVPYYL
jgi:hypothetical protein